MKLLEVQDLCIRYGPISAVSGLSFSVDEGETVALVGPNGSGKSSVLLAIMGIVKPADGEILFRGRSLLPLKPWERVKLGIGILPENRRLFEDFTVLENLELAVVSSGAAGKFVETRALASFPYLAAKGDLPCRLLSGGERQLAALARLQIQNPTIALLDDPTAGLDNTVRTQFLNLLTNLGLARILAVPSAQSMNGETVPEGLRHIEMLQEVHHGI